MKLSDIEQMFLNSSDESCKRFLRRNIRQLAKRNLLGRFYKLYAQKNHKIPDEIIVKEEDPYQFMFEPLKGGDLDEN
jgi:hypothetical protein